MALLNNIYVLVTDETVIRDVSVSTHAVEEGKSFSDHVTKRGAELLLKGVIVSYDEFSAAQVLSQLQNLQVSGSLIKYSGRNLYNNLQITAFNTSHPNTVWGGCTFDMKLKEARIAGNLSGSGNSPTAIAQAQVVTGNIGEVWHTWGTLDANSLNGADTGKNLKLAENHNINSKAGNTQIPVENIRDVAQYYDTYPKLTNVWEKIDWIKEANGGTLDKPRIMVGYKEMIPNWNVIT